MAKQLFLNLSIPGWIFFILFWLLIALAVIYYRKTLPPLSILRRSILVILRSLSLIIIFFLLFKPVLELFFEQREKPAIAILYDNSSSMKIEDPSGIRGDSLQYALKYLSKNWSPDSLTLKPYQFAGKLSALSGDSLDFSGSQTNLSAALETIQDSLQRHNIQSVILLSDGQFNAGANPLISAKKSAVPIYTVPVGDSAFKKDVRVTNLKFPPVAYAGDTILIKVDISQTGFSQVNKIVKLKQNDRLLSTKNVLLPPSGFQKQIELLVKTSEPGEFRYRVEIEGDAQEITTQNNSRQFLLNVLKNKLKLLVVSGQPVFDQRLLLQVLRQLADIQLFVLSENPSGGFYEKNIQNIEADSMDVILMLGYPTRNSNASFLNHCLLAVQKQKIPVFLILNRNTQLPALSPLFDLLSLQKDSRINESLNTMAELTTAGILHPVTRIEEDTQLLQELWSNLPPVIGYGRGLKLLNPAVLLLKEASAGNQQSSPLLYASTRSENKSLVLAAANIGSWHFQLQDDPRRETLFKDFIDQAIRWLVSREDIQKINISTNQKVFNLGEVVEFSGQVFDDFYHPMNEAQLELKVRGENFVLDDVINREGDEYRYQASGVPSGSFTFQVIAKKGEQLLGQIQGKFVVEQLELELQETKANPALLREIAAAAGGKSWSMKRFLQESAHFKLQEQVQILTFEHILWNQWYWLLLLVLFLSSEWFLRKRWGLL
jgi:hypothetical protein